MKTAIEHAQAGGRDYITPEDITAALDVGANPVDIAIEVLAAFAKQSVGLEDGSLCAFVTWRALKEAHENAV